MPVADLMKILNPRTEEIRDGRRIIYLSRKADKNGRLSSCNGAMTGTDVSFRFSRCDTSLRQRLMAKDVTGVPKQVCGNIPAGGIPVAFTMGAGEAINVTEI